MDNLLEINQLQCRYGHQTVLEDFSLHIAPGMIGSLLGPSGCGKTTVLRAIAGFEPVAAGTIRLRGEVISSKGHTHPPDKRGLGMVFQDYALFPHLSVEENICFGLRGLSRRKQRAESESLLELVGLEGYAKRYPHELSGGQQQRVALARALAPNPRLLLLDEPFSNLDVELRERLAMDVRNILKSRKTAALFVTHDQHEAFVMGERIAVMNQGQVAQWDTPFNLYHEPADRFVADFIGEGRFLRGNLAEPSRVTTPLGNISGNRAYSWPKGSPVEILLRPDDVHLDEHHPLKCRISERAFRGAETLYTVELPGGTELLSLMPSRYDFTVGQEIGVEIDVEHLILFSSRP
ncbi:MAG: ABC transporter ATP-binding protein [Sedimenticola sp.]